jgi:N-acetylmuramoyl-L-alanine amidase
MLVATQAAAGAVVTAVRTGEHASMTRFVLELSEAVEYEVFTLDKPYRVVIDFPDVTWRIFGGEVVETGGLIESFRFGSFRAGVERLVLDVSGPVEVRNAFILPPQGQIPYRFVLDVASVSAASFQASPPSAPPDSLGETQASPSGKRVVVLDPGHGGVDPGTIGVNGIHEKDVTLALARELRTRLVAGDRYHVLMTRDADVFVKLRDRVSKARDAAAELFVSLHADAIKNRRHRGASVYTLSEDASDGEAAALAEKENRADIIAGLDLSGRDDVVSQILIDLAQGETMNLSVQFANLLIPEIAKNAAVLRNSRRQAGFAVLKAPDVPSVLVELGYLSNSEDEALLSSATGRALLVEALVRGIDRFFDD